MSRLTPPDAAPLLSAHGVSFGYAPGRPALRGVSFAVGRGERAALVGPNGAGKTTLLRLLGGTLAPQSGELRYRDTPLREVGRRRLARRIAVVPQRLPAGPLEEFTVEQFVSLGRTPHAGWLGLRGETGADRAAVAEAIDLTGCGALAGRSLAELSGGEQQRALLALAFAQQAEILLLDEPTRHLDVHHQVAVLDLVSELARSRALTVVAVLHDLDLAALYFPHLALLDRGRIVAEGAPDEVLTGERLTAVYGPGVEVFPHPRRAGVPLVLPAPTGAAQGAAR